MKAFSVIATCALTGCAVNLPADLDGVSDATLCDVYARTSDQRAYEEIKRRDLLTDEERKHVLGRQITLGMSEIAVICAWGQPSDVNRTVGSWGVHEQWVYCGRDAWGQRRTYPCIASNYVYFENGEVSAWQN